MRISLPRAGLTALLTLLGIAVCRAQDDAFAPDSSDVSVLRAASVPELIRGRVPGVLVSNYGGNPAGAFNVGIRGVNALRGDNSPLWVVNGTVLCNPMTSNLRPFWQMEGKAFLEQTSPLMFLSPRDIESIEVVRNASSAAEYGARGACGVVIIKTREAVDRPVGVDLHSTVSYSGGLSHNHYVGVSGTKNKAGWLLSGHYTHLKGCVPRSSSDFGGVLLDFRTEASDRVRFGMTAVLDFASISNPSATAFWKEGSAALAMRGLMPGEECTAEMWSRDYDDDTQEYRLLTSAWAEVSFTPSLKWKTMLGCDFRHNDRYVWYGSGTPLGNSLDAAAAILNSQMFSVNASTRLDWHRYFSTDHLLSIGAGAVLYGQYDVYNTMNGSDFFTENLRAKGLSLMKSTALNHKFSSEGLQWGAFLSASYSYRDVAGVDAALRIDEYPVFDAVPLLFPRAEVWWRIFPFLRLDAGWGKVGKQNRIPYERTGEYLNGSFPALDADTAIYYDALNRLSGDEWNASLSFSFFSGRLDFSIGGYCRRTVDSYDLYSFLSEDSGKYLERGPRKLAWSTSASLRNSGMELALDALLVSSGDFKWDLSLNLTWNVNRIMSAGPHDIFAPAIGGGMVASGNLPGYGVGSILGYEVDEFDDVVDSDGDGKITESDMKVLGQTQPKLYGGLETSFRWRRLCLDLRLTGAGLYRICDLNRAAADGARYLTWEYVGPGDYLRLSSLSLGYDIPLKTGKVRSLKVTVGGTDLVTLTRYSGWNPDVNVYGIHTSMSGFDYGSYPLKRGVVAGVSLCF